MPNEKKAAVTFGQKMESRHKIILEQRANAAITGVTDVVSFDEASIIADTESGALVIKGVELHISNLNLENGLLELTGEVNSITYDIRGSYGKNKKSLMGRIFK